MLGETVQALRRRGVAIEGTGGSAPGKAIEGDPTLPRGEGEHTPKHPRRSRGTTGQSVVDVKPGRPAEAILDEGAPHPGQGDLPQGLVETPEAK